MEDKNLKNGEGASLRLMRTGCCSKDLKKTKKEEKIGSLNGSRCSGMRVA